jgi:ubiquinone/menaquinone biosynthesis C-methylase UbiE
MDRIPEPELMLDERQAEAYASADFEEPHSSFISLLREKLPNLSPTGVAVDLGCGPGDIALRFARVSAGWTIDAVDGSHAMLELGRRALAGSGLEPRVRFYAARLPADSLPQESYDLLLSNSLLHHLAEPAMLWSSVRRWARPESAVFVMDLLRPKSQAEARSLVERYASDEPEVLRSDFYHSLLAAYRPDEVSQQLEAGSLGHLELEVVSDRHFIVWGQVWHANIGPSEGRSW